MQENIRENIRLMVRRAAVEHGGRTAIECGEASLSYRDLERRAGALADHLLRLGLARGSVVGILTAVSGRLVTAILGVLEAGGIFLPLDPRVPAPRLASMVEEARPRFFLADRELAGLAAEIAPGAEAGIVFLDELDEPIDEDLPSLERPELGGDDPCYIYFTSGSTGRPKGVTGRLKAIDHFIRWEIETFELAHGPRVSQLTAPSFDAFLRDAFVPLASGGTLCVPPDRGILGDAGKLVEWIDGQRIELVHCVPSLLRTLLGEELAPERFHALRQVLLAGEPLLPADVERWTAVFGRRIELVNLYGPSETTMVKFFYRVQPEDAERRTIPIGKPMRGARGLIFDPRGKPGPAGAIGEIYIRTPYRSLGYYNRPEETAEVFVRNPMSEDPNDLLYRTGDLGRVLEDGDFEFMGRKDQQVKIRGVRVELEEIEGLLSRHEAVREAAVVDQPDRQGNLFLACFVVLRPGFDPELLRGHLAGLLPESMVPSRFVAVGELPRSINGKIDRRGLRALAEAKSGAEGEHVPPRTELEAMLAGLFSQLLGVERVGIHDNFFQLGGHSLLATQLVARLRHSLDLEVSLRSLLQRPTVAGLAEEVEALRRLAPAPEAPPLAPVARGTDLPLSFAQQRLWFLNELEPGSPAYNMPFGLRFKGRLDVRALRETFREIVRRHESLRTVFLSAGGVPRQVVQPDGGADLPLLDLSALPPSLRESHLGAEAAAAYWRPFDLRRGPLVRAEILKLAEDEHVVVFCMHHIISDAWSVGILVREVTALYGAAVEGRPDPLPPLPIQYADFAAWQRSWLQGEALERQIRYWRERLAGAEPLALPVDRSAARHRSARGVHWMSWSPELTAKLRGLAAGTGATLFMVALAALKALLHRITGQRDTSVGIPIANRTRVELEGLIGFFVNTLVLRTTVGGEAMFRDLLGQVRETAIEAQAHQDLPFEKLIEELDPERNLDQTPLFRVMFDLAVGPPQEIRLPGLRLEPLSLDTGGEAKLDLLLNLRESGGILEGLFEYRPTLFEPATIQRWAGYLTAILEAAAAEPGRRLDEIPMLSEAERHQALVERNEGRLDASGAGLFRELFAERARRSPEAPALILDEGSATYRELADRAGRLAGHLAGLGVRPGVLVAVCMDRSRYLIEAYLGILLAGGGFVPVEPDLPRERAGLLLEESGSRLLITRQSLLSVLPERVPVLCLDCDEDLLAGEEPNAPPSPHDPAYVMFTSGSTGRPKGVVVPHRSLAWYTRAASDQYALGPDDRILQVSSIGFDISVEEIFPFLACGATVCLCADPLLRSPAFFLERCRHWRVTALSVPTAFWHALVDEIAGRPESLPDSLRLLILGGEAPNPARLDLWRAWASPAVRLVNTYGPTETTVAATLRDLNGPAGGELAPVPIGRPIRGAEAYVLDEALGPVPAGVAGELFLGGAGCSRGYLGRPDLTAERFLPHPFAGEPGQRLYRTGDLARALPDGDLEFAGRVDHQVKIRGFRVEPGEIEAVLAGHPRVRDAVVLAHGEAPEGKRLCAWVVLNRTDPSDPASALSSWLRERLPAYMVPAAWAFLEAIPLTPGGKLDRRALPAPQGARAAAGSYAAPSGPVEELLAGIWAEVLRLDRVGAEDNFFALGGHSLLATQMVSRVREALGLELPLRRVFEAPTIRQLAAGLREAPPVLPGAPALSPRKAAAPGGAPLSFAQQRLWILDRLEPGNPAYNLPQAVRLTGELSVEALERSFAEVVRRHEVLRTTFTVRNGQPAQVAAPPRAALRLLDLSGVPEPSLEARRLALEEAGRPFDLERGPLLRLLLLRLGEREHLLVVTLHHIVSDGWSMGVLLRELGALYPAFLRGEPSPLPELPLQYADFARWQRSWLQGAVLEEQLAYWNRKLAGAPTRLDLPTDRPRPAVQSYRGAAMDVALPPGLSAAIQDLCRRAEVTPFMLLLSAWGLLLGRLAGRREVLVGTAIAGRNRREIEDLIGFFVNTLVLRIELDGEGPSLTFAGLLGKVRATALEAFTHQDLPFERIVEELVPERDLSRAPLIQVLFALQNTPVQSVAVPGLSFAPVSLRPPTAKVDLNLVLGEGEGGFSGELEHNTDLFDRATAERLLARFVALLEKAVADPARTLADLPLLLPAEMDQMLREWNAPRTEYPRETSLTGLFGAVARERPEAPAVIGPRTWCYRQLDEESGRLARRLRALGVRAGSTVGISMERSPELVLGMLAILKAGGAYVPLDASYPGERLAFLLEDTGARLVLVQEGTREKIEAQGARALLVESGAEEVADASPEPLPPGVPAEALAYLLYTSGSTGRPKGVAVPHRAIVRLAKGTPELALRPDDRLAWNANTSFDAATFEIWAALLNGAALVVISQDLLLEPAALAGHLRRERVTVLHLTAALFAQVARDAPEALAWPRRVLFGGEASSPAAVARALENGRPRELLHMYGPTESTTFATWHPVAEVEPGAKTVPIGRPLANTAVYVLDPWRQLAAPEQPGELCIGGEGLAWGYWNRPELTAERFVPDPWSAEPGGRLYRTGDLVRRRPDGALDFQGRLDQQVKIRGFRIEPGEVEAVLAGHPEVRDAVVQVRGDDSEGRRLVAWVVLDPTDRTDPSDANPPLSSWLRERLPDYMIPSAWVLLDALPLTANGKVDRRALPEPESGPTRGYVAPSDPLEETLAAIWAGVLRRERVGAHDDFFALGGHSLLAIQVISRVRDELGVELPLRRLFEAPTVHQLARFLREAQPADGSSPVLSRGEEDGPAPVSFAQQRLWFLDQLEPGNPAYNLPSAVRLTGELSIEALERTFAEVVRRHAALRTTFAVENGQPVQVIVPPDAARPELRVLDLSDAPEEAREEWALELAREEALHPFDLRNGPLLRLGLLRLDERDHLLLVTFHHIVSDGWSIGVLLREIGALYPAFLRGEPSPLPELPLQYADFARWQRSWLQGEVLERQLAYWREKLAGAPALLELPTDRPRPALPTWRGAALPLALPPALSEAVQELCRSREVTPFMLLLAAWAVLLGRHAGQDDVLVGSPIAGRNRREIEDLIGFFVNTLVLRADLSGNPAFGELLGRVRETALDAFAHQDLPFERIVEEVVPERDLTHSPLFQVFFALQNAPAQSLAVPGLSFDAVGLETRMAKFDLSLVLGDGPAGFHGGLEYSSDLFDGATAGRLLGRFVNLLAGAAEDPGRPLSELRLMDAAEERMLLADLNRSEHEWALPIAVHDLFARQAERTPDKAAAVGPQGEVTYREIEERSSALAGRLRSPRLDRRIGLLCDPDPQVLVGMIGILKAGAGFVPIDPRQPDERLAWILEDSACEALVTQQRHLERLERLIPGPRILCLEDALPSRAEPQVAVDPRALAYIVYTSGSTGRPKGVQVSHESLVPMLLWGCDYFGLGETTRALQSLSFFFDFGIFEHLTTVIAGGTLYFPGEAAGDPAAFAREVVRHGINTLHTTPAFAHALASAGQVLDSLEIVHLGGEALSRDTVERLREAAPRAVLYNGYGPTEATINSSIFRIEEDAGWPVVPIGRRSADNALYILDRESRLVPFGARGELHVGGIGVARGYLNRPDLTAERFVPDPFGAAPGGRLYRTGDLVRHLPGGDIQFLGRIDHQVKLRGFRIELGEIEAVLRSHPGVREAVATVWEDRLVAWLVVDRTDGTDQSDPTDLNDWLRARLPEYMVPSALVVVEELPLTPTGKVDRKALPAPDRGADPSAYVAPGDAVEEKLADIWREVLRTDRVGVHDNFFAIGGHSLLATQVVTRVRETMGVDIPLRRIFESPTVARLARDVWEALVAG